MIPLTMLVFLLRWIETGRKMLSDLLARSEKDPKDFCLAYDNLVDFLETQVLSVRLLDQLSYLIVCVF